MGNCIVCSQLRNMNKTCAWCSMSCCTVVCNKKGIPLLAEAKGDMEKEGGMEGREQVLSLIALFTAYDNPPNPFL